MKAQTIDTDTLQTMLNEGKPVTILDIRHTDEFQEWHIPNSYHVAAYDALKVGEPAPLQRIDIPRDTPVVTVCGAGVVSQEAAQQLQKQGYEAFSLAGGMKAWSLAWNSAKVPTPSAETTIIQIRRTGKGCLSYMIGSRGKTAIFDAALEPDIYLELARQHGWQITHVFDTHIHADHLSRSRLMARITGAKLFLPSQERVTFTYTSVQDNDLFQIGSVRISAIHTPGHTAESTCYLINNEALITGDTLFLTAVGRPDLKANPEESRRRGHLLYRSLQKLLALPEETLILPGHTSEPVAFDDQALAAPLAQVQQQIPLLTLAENDFVGMLLQRLPAVPPNHQRIVELNMAGEMPAGDVTNLEAGANRCAVA